MRNFLIVFLCTLIFVCCNGKRPYREVEDKQIKPTNDSRNRRKTIDWQMALGDRPDDEQEGPSFKEVLSDLIASCNQVKYIDKAIINGGDTLRLKETYYCLHDSSLSVPKKYLWGGDTTKNFVTNNFASKLIVIHNRDTVFNKIFYKADFNQVISGQLKKYAILFNPDYLGYSKEKQEFAIGFSISIPLTDVGVPAYIVIDKKGNYRVLDQYAKIDRYKKN